jgi:hypothetical protein
MHLYALPISEGALDAMLQRAKPCFCLQALFDFPRDAAGRQPPECGLMR